MDAGSEKTCFGPRLQLIWEVCFGHLLPHLSPELSCTKCQQVIVGENGTEWEETGRAMWVV